MRRGYYDENLASWVGGILLLVLKRLGSVSPEMIYNKDDASEYYKTKVVLGGDSNDGACLCSCISAYRLENKGPYRT